MCMCSAFSDLFGDLLNKKEDRASCPLPQSWPNQNKCSCSEEIRLDAELEAAINGFHFIFVVAANIKFVQSKMLGFFFFRMVKFSLGIWHHAPDCDGNSLLFDTWTSNSSWIGVFLCPLRRCIQPSGMWDGY